MFVTAFLWQSRHLLMSQRKPVSALLCGLAFLLPTHFCHLTALVFKLKSLKLEDESEKVFKDHDPNTNDTLELCDKYVELTHSIEANRKEHVKAIHLKNTNGRIETICETLPQAVMMISLSLLSYSYPTLRNFVENDFVKTYIPIDYSLFIGLLSLKTAFACISSVLKIR